MKTVKIIALAVMSLISVKSFAQGKVEDLKNPTIKAFLTSLDGKQTTAQKSLEKYCSKEVIDDKMIPMGADVVIREEEDNCVTFQTTWIIDPADKEEGTSIMVYDICEEGGKITLFSLNFDDDVDDEE